VERVCERLGTDRAFGRSTILGAVRVPSVQFQLSTGDWYGREVESEEAAVQQVKSFFDRHDEYLRDWIKVDGNAWIARSAVVAVEVHTDTEPRDASR
jgi:hypothetical protein